MSLSDKIKEFEKKKILVIGEALIDKYISGFADKISPDAPVPNIKIENRFDYLGGIGLASQYIKSLGGIPEILTIVGGDYEGELFLRKIKELKIESSGIYTDVNLKTPQITRIKAMNQHVLRLETDYTSDISQPTRQKFFEMIEQRSSDLGAIIILDYGMGGLFEDKFIQKLLIKLKQKYKNIPIIARPNLNNYYLYEGIDLIKINLQKALNILSINCYNETSIIIVGKKILNTSKCKNVLLNYLESESYLFSKGIEKIEKIEPILKQPVRSYVAVSSVMMAVLGLGYASGFQVKEVAQAALYAAALTAKLPPVKFFGVKELKDFISAN